MWRSHSIANLLCLSSTLITFSLVLCWTVALPFFWASETFFFFFFFGCFQGFSTKGSVPLVVAIDRFVSIAVVAPTDTMFCCLCTLYTHLEAEHKHPTAACCFFPWLVRMLNVPSDKFLLGSLSLWCCVSIDSQIFPLVSCLCSGEPPDNMNVQTTDWLGWSKKSSLLVRRVGESPATSDLLLRSDVLLDSKRW